MDDCAGRAPVRDPVSRRRGTRHVGCIVRVVPHHALMALGAKRWAIAPAPSRVSGVECGLAVDECLPRASAAVGWLGPPRKRPGASLGAGWSAPLRGADPDHGWVRRCVRRWLVRCRSGVRAARAPLRRRPDHAVVRCAQRRARKWGAASETLDAARDRLLSDGLIRVGRPGARRAGASGSPPVLHGQG